MPLPDIGLTFGKPELERRVHCPNHELNTTDLAALKSSTSIIKTFLQIGLPLIVTVGLFIASVAYNAMTGTLQEIRTDLKEVKTAIIISNLADTSTRMEVEQIKKDVLEIQLELARPTHAQRR